MMRVRSTSVKGLSAPEIRAEGVDVLFLVWLISRAATDLIDSALSGTELTADEFAVYSILRAAGAITPTDLARWMAAAPTTVSSYVKRFEARGHVSRAPHPEDGRSYRITLTAAGRRAYRDAATRFRPVLSRVESTLTDGAATREALLQLRTSLDHVRDTLPRYWR
jgi:DNA-binding MarR family transcriptional regulator